MEPVKITSAANQAIEQKVAAKEDAIGLRLEITNTGCSGHAYEMRHVRSDEDVSGDDQFGKLFVPKIHSWMLFGITIDYVETDMESGFTFENPNESGRCGCGESFSVERQT